LRSAKNTLNIVRRYVFVLKESITIQKHVAHINIVLEESITVQ